MRNQFGEPLSVVAERVTFKAFSTTKAVHYEGSGPFSIVPVFDRVTLVEFVAAPPPDD
jgi:hypothetical protein